MCYWYMPKRDKRQFEKGTRSHKRLSRSEYEKIPQKPAPVPIPQKENQGTKEENDPIK
jgi:hypothetical protein